MAFSLKHAFASLKSDGVDPTIVQPSNWNAEHTMLVDSGKILGRTTAGNGPVEEIDIASVGGVTSVAGKVGAVGLVPADITGLRIGTAKIWVQSTDPGGAAADGDIWVKTP